MISRIRRLKSTWLPDDELELQRLSSFKPPNLPIPRNLTLPILRALEFEQRFSATHHVFVYCQSFVDGLATMLFKEINFHLTQKKLPYRQQFGYIDQAAPIVEEDIRECGQKFIEIGQSIRSSGLKLEKIMQNFSQNELIKAQFEIKNTFFYAGVKKYERALPCLSVSRLSDPDPYQSFLFCNDKAEDLREFVSAKFRILYTKSADIITSLFSAILESRKVNTGMLNVILVPKNLKDVFFNPTTIYLNQMLTNQEIFTIRLVNDEKEYMKGIKQQFRSLPFSKINEFVNKHERF